MICWNPQPGRVDPEIANLGEFLDAIEDGATVVAHPDTAALLAEKVPFPIETCEFMEPGMLYAVNLPPLEDWQNAWIPG